MAAARTSDALALVTDVSVNPFACVQCGRCSSGCPTAFETGHSPRLLMRYLQWGWIDEAVHSPFPWYCVSCQACTTRCPRGLDILGMIFALRREAMARGVMRSDLAGHFCGAYMDQARDHHRVSELLLGMRMVWATGFRWDDFLLFIRLLLKGRIATTRPRVIRSAAAKDRDGQRGG